MPHPHPILCFSDSVLASLSLSECLSGHLLTRHERRLSPTFRDSSETCSSHPRMLPGALAFVNMIEPSFGHFDEVAQAVGLLRGRGLTPVPHIPACRFSSREEIELTLAQMRHTSPLTCSVSPPPPHSITLPSPFCIFLYICIYSLYLSSLLFGLVSSEVTSHLC